MKFLFFVVSFFVFLSPAIAVDLSHNLVFQSLKKEQEAADIKKGHLGRSFFPDLSLTVGEEYLNVEDVPSKTQPFGYLEGRLNLYNGGKDQLKSEIIEIESELGKVKLSLFQRDLLKQIRELQVEIDYSKKLLEILSKEKEKNRSIMAQADKKANSGLTTKTDILEFSIYDSEIDEEMKALEHELEKDFSKLAFLTGEGAKRLVNSKKIKTDQSLDLDTLNLNSEVNPEVMLHKLESQVFFKQRDIEKKYWLPSVDLYAGQYKNFEVFNRDYQERSQSDAQIIGVRVTFNLFNGGINRISSRSSLSLAESKELMATQARRESELEFERIKHELVFTEQSINLISKRITRGRELLKVSLQEYQRGVKNSLDALTALQRYYGFEKRLLSKKREFELTKIELLALLGE